MMSSHGFKREEKFCYLIDQLLIYCV